MKETVNVSIASQAFTLDNDAWRMLDSYLKNIRDRIDPDDNETIADIEARIADIFREHLPSAMMVVTASMVRTVMEQIGSPEIFGTPRRSAADCGTSGEERRSGDRLQHPFRRSKSDRVLAGICGGIAAQLSCDAALIRLITILLIVFGGLSLWIYVILWLVIPAEA